MEIGMVGLGKMGANMSERLLRGGHRVLAYDLDPEAVGRVAAVGATAAGGLAELVEELSPPRRVWLMLPAGQVTEQALTAIAKLLSPGDTLVDGGNSNYKDSQRRGKALEDLGLHFLDVGVSGGIWGLKEGYCLMVGGRQEVVENFRPVFESLAPAPNRGWGRVGPQGAGHFTKMIHNGIEYGLMQAYAEGFEILKAKGEFELSLGQVTEIWRHGSVVRSWLLDLIARAFSEDEELAGVRAWVPDSGEGRWTVSEAIDLEVPAPVITLSLQRRFRSRQEEPFADKVLAVLRNQFGGHAVFRED